MNKAAQIIIILSIFILLTDSESNGQFIEHFAGEPKTEWITFAGDGDAKSSFEWHDNFARFIVDATDDRQNVWWAIMRTPSVDNIDIEQRSEPGYELKLEARVRPSHAPRRLNMRLSTQRTVSNYEYLMEFDLSDTDKWHTISMTTRNFDAVPGDTISAHIALMDWGTSVYELDVDYIKIDVVDVSASSPDKGEQVVYPPPAPTPEEFHISSPALEVGIIDIDVPKQNHSPRHIHIPRPVIQRLLNGRTKGIAIYPLGALQASFYPGQIKEDSLRPALYFNVSK